MVDGYREIGLTDWLFAAHCVFSMFLFQVFKVY